MQRLAAEYVLPVRWADRPAEEVDELGRYLRELAGTVDVTVVDGSAAADFARHAAAWSAPGLRHLPPDPWPGRNGKVRGVVTGVRRARHEHVVIADDDVRYRPQQLAEVVALLERADLVRPQNVFAPQPWHARWDTARSLLNRAFGEDWPGTFGVRRSTFCAMGGYDGDVLFENLQMVRTVRASGGRCTTAWGTYVQRRPPQARHFLGQRVRQAYDDFAQPGRLLLEASWLPAALLALTRGRRGAVLVAAGLAASVVVAERGRRRAGGAAHYPASAALWAPAWVCERAVCVWLAVAARARGGVRYAGSRQPHAVRDPGARREPLTPAVLSPAAGPGSSGRPATAG
ncbi:glycosyltransferase [Kineococcus sp. SYSU DK006]|uniref:glycosyltransferase n=1 Tax=Kineococcus sp. SYSU DK006 TaxID=3383127 RepID=UPI003D7E8542